MISGTDVANKLYETALLVKRYHWTVRGNDAVAAHLQLDELFDELVDWSDRLFENAIGNGFDGLYFDFSLQDAGNDVSATLVAEKLTAIFTNLNNLIEAAEGANPRSTNNILDDVSEGLTKWIYLFQRYSDG